MDQDIIKSAIKSNLDAFDTFFKWFLSVAVIIWWAGLSQDEKDIQFLGLSIERSRSFAVVGVFFIVINCVFLFKLRKLHFLIQETSSENKVHNLSLVFTHGWDLNPFVISARSSSGGWMQALQRSFLVIIWWLCNMSLFSLVAPNTGIYLVITLSFLLIGLLSLMEIIAICNTMAQLTDDIQEVTVKEKIAQLKHTIRPALSMGVLIGFAITIIAVLKQYCLKIVLILGIGCMLAACGEDKQALNDEWQRCQETRRAVDSMHNALKGNRNKEERDLVLATEMLMRLCYADMLLNSVRHAGLDTGALPAAPPQQKRGNAVFAGSMVSVSAAASIGVLSANTQSLATLRISAPMPGSLLKISPAILSAGLGSAAISSGLAGGRSPIKDSLSHCRFLVETSAEELLDSYIGNITSKYADLFLLDGRNVRKLHEEFMRTLVRSLFDTAHRADSLFLLKFALKERIITNKEYNVYVALQQRIAAAGNGDTTTAIVQRIDQTHAQIRKLYATIAPALSSQPDTLLNEKLKNLDHQVKVYFMLRGRKLP